ncbi:MAG: NosL family protein [Proteobacteria bacterium]|nr:NosL family protein [Pseudomonadota bacterium]
MRKQFLPCYIVAALLLSSGTVLAGQMPGHNGHDHMTEAAVGSNHADVVKYKACAHCGMDREKFAYSRMLITYADGSSVGVCSLHCAVTEMKDQKNKVVKMIEVADLNTKKLVDAKKATWVLGGEKKGVMTRVPKWAFAKKADAVAFIAKYGGKLATYKEALDMAENN